MWKWTEMRWRLEGREKEIVEIRENCGGVEMSDCQSTAWRKKRRREGRKEERRKCRIMEEEEKERK